MHARVRSHRHLAMATYSGCIPRQAKLAIDFPLLPGWSPHEELTSVAKNQRHGPLLTVQSPAKSGHFGPPPC
jgi:hypothetical protein